MMPRFHTRRAIALMIVAFLLLPIPFLSSAEDATPGDGIPAESSTSPNIIFTDIQGHWAEPAIQKAVTAGIVKGYGDDTFRPDQPITNSEFRLLIHRSAISAVSAGLKWPSGTGGYDSPSETTGTPGTGTAANLDAPITRQEAATLLLTLPLPNVPGGQAGPVGPVGSAGPVGIPSFPDWSDVADWARDAMATMVAIGYLTGHDDGYLRPDWILSRAEGATLLTRVLDSRLETIVPPAPEPPATEQFVQAANTAASAQQSTPSLNVAPAQNTPSPPTITYINHLGILIRLETDGSGAVTSFAAITELGEGDLLLDATTIARITGAGLSADCYRSNVVVWEAQLTDTNLFQSYQESTLSAIAAGEVFSLYNTSTGAVQNGKANLIVHHRGIPERYGVVLKFYSSDDEGDSPYFTQARISLKTVTGETRNFAITTEGAIGSAVANPEAYSANDLIEYHVNESGVIDGITLGAVQVIDEYEPLQLVDRNTLKLRVSEGGIATTYDLLIARNAAVFELDDRVVSAKGMDEVSFGAINDRNPSLITLGEGSHAVVQALFLGDATPPVVIDPDAATIEIMDALRSDPSIIELNGHPVLHMTVTDGGINANSTEFIGEDGTPYPIDPDTRVYFIDGTSYTRETIFDIYPGDTLTLYKDILLR